MAGTSPEEVGGGNGRGERGNDLRPTPASASVQFSPSKLVKKSSTSLLRRLLAKTFSDATPPKGKVSPSSKIAITFEVMQLYNIGVLQDLKRYLPVGHKIFTGPVVAGPVLQTPLSLINY